MAKRSLMAVSIDGGIITLINEEGEIKEYLQRGVYTMSEEKTRRLIGLGLLNKRWNDYDELPEDVSIYYEDEEIIGKANVTYPDIDIDNICDEDD